MDPAPVWPDLHTFPFENFRGLVDILSGGFPCQPFSQAGARLGVEDPRHLWPRIVEGIRRCRPAVVFFENVDGIATAASPGHESVLHNVLCDLEGLDYRATADLFTAQELGAPHVRKRWFILGVADTDLARCEGDQRIRKTREEGQPGGHATECGEHVADTDRARARRSDNVLGDSCPNGQGGEDSSPHCIPASEELIKPNMADSNCCGGGQDPEHREQWTGRTIEPSSDSGRMHTRTDEEVTRWPAPPGLEQHPWEEPRTTQPGMGGATDGAATELDPTLNRVERLRMLGNGIVPDQAARAFATLMAELLDIEVNNKP